MQPKRTNDTEKAFHRKIIDSNIAEAKEALQDFERKAADGELSEGELQVRLQHA